MRFIQSIHRGQEITKEAGAVSRKRRENTVYEGLKWNGRARREKLKWGKGGSGRLRG